jgi:hypothetical protein
MQSRTQNKEIVVNLDIPLPPGFSQVLILKRIVDLDGWASLAGVRSGPGWKSIDTEDDSMGAAKI